jgi:uncharacterized protein YndB with AHSA1/START domain
MSDAVLDTQYKLEVKKTVNASRERVYKAWTNPDSLSKWFISSPQSKSKSVGVDLRVGGSFRIEVIDGDGDLIAASGVYKEIDPPSKLVFTWKWDESSVEKGESIVSVNLVDLGAKTEITVVHAKLASEESARRHTFGWNGCLDTLANYVEGEDS